MPARTIRCALLVLSLGFFVTATAAELRMVRGLSNPESVLVTPEGRIFVTQIGEFDKDGDGSIAEILPDGSFKVFAPGLDDPRGIAMYGKFFYVTDRTRVWTVAPNGKASVLVDAKAFPIAPRFLNDIVIDRGDIYVSDSGDAEKGGGAIYKVAQDRKVTAVVSSQDARVKSPNGLLVERGVLMWVDFASGELYRIHLTTLKITKVAEGFGAGDGLVQDKRGNVYISDFKGGKVWRVDMTRSPLEPKAYEQKFEAPADIGLDWAEEFILVPDLRAGTLTWLPIGQ